MRLIDLREGLDRLGTVKGIRDNVQFKGSNVWMLMASTFITSIGLDQGSGAVIIGAMLISPLMSPILGVGLSVGINDRSLLVMSLKDFFIAMVVTLIISTFYYLVTPFGKLTPEIIMRTKPTSLDVLVAFFGGVAGIIAQSRKEKTAAIPGVAIAIALMPPLCVTGYGIAKGDLNIMLGAFYLFFLNSVFISLSTYLIVRFLGFRYKEHIDRDDKIRTRIFIIVFVILVILPSLYFLYNLINEDRQRQLVNRFIKEEFSNEDYNAVRSSFINMDSFHVLKIYVLGKYINEDTIDIYQDKLSGYGLSNTRLKIIQSNLSERERAVIRREFRERESDYIHALELSQQFQEEKDDQLHRMREILSDTLHFQTIKKELKVLFPSIESIAYSNVKITDFEESKGAVLVFVNWDEDTGPQIQETNENKIREYFKVRFGIENTIVREIPAEMRN